MDSNGVGPLITYTALTQTQYTNAIPIPRVKPQRTFAEALDFEL